MGSKVQPRPNILVVDVGGTHVKLKATTGNDERREFSSGRRLTAQKAVAGIQQLAGDWKYDAVTIGVPAPVINGRILHEPHNLGSGWVRFDFHAAFGCPVKIINDAAMQALGSYHGDSMLFLGLGTGLGSTMIVDGVIVPMELAHLPYKKKTFEDYVGLAGLERLGKKKWRLAVFDVVKRLREAARNPTTWHLVAETPASLRNCQRVWKSARIRMHSSAAFVSGTIQNCRRTPKLRLGFIPSGHRPTAPSGLAS